MSQVPRPNPSQPPDLPSWPVVKLNHISGDTFAIDVEGEVSLVDSETLKRLLQPGRPL